MEHSPDIALDTRRAGLKVHYAPSRPSRPDTAPRFPDLQIGCRDLPWPRRAPWEWPSSLVHSRPSHADRDLTPDVPDHSTFSVPLRHMATSRNPRQNHGPHQGRLRTTSGPRQIKDHVKQPTSGQPANHARPVLGRRQTSRIRALSSTDQTALPFRYRPACPDRAGWPLYIAALTGDRQRPALDRRRFRRREQRLRRL